MAASRSLVMEKVGNFLHFQFSTWIVSSANFALSPRGKLTQCYYAFEQGTQPRHFSQSRPSIKMIHMRWKWEKKVHFVSVFMRGIGSIQETDDGITSKPSAQYFTVSLSYWKCTQWTRDKADLWCLYFLSVWTQGLSPQVTSITACWRKEVQMSKQLPADRTLSVPITTSWSDSLLSPPSTHREDRLTVPVAQGNCRKPGK